MTPQEVRDRWSDIAAELQDAVTQAHRVCNDPGPIGREEVQVLFNALVVAQYHLQLLRAQMG